MSIIRGNRYDEDKLEFVKVTEFCKPEIIEKKFTDEEVRIIQTEFNDKLELVYTRDGRHAIKTFHYVGYIVLPNHIIKISSKIPNISFINMVRYGLGLLELKSEDFPASDESQPNYYDTLVSFLLQELELILQRGLYTSYANYEDNLTTIRGKILFKEQLLYNYTRGDKVFCSFSELTSDILENRIIKYALFYLSQCHFIDDNIVSKLIEYYKRMDQVELVSVHGDDFKSINYSLLNNHYIPILKICELILRDSSLDLDVIGNKTAASFAIDMNKLFTANLLIEKLGEGNIRLQQTEYPEVKGNKLKVRLDIKIFQDGMPHIILDTKYKEYDTTPDLGYIAQLSLYSLSTHIKNCGLVYVGKFQPEFFLIKPDIRVHILPFNLVASSKLEFEENCSKFEKDLKSLPI